MPGCDEILWKQMLTGTISRELRKKGDEDEGCTLRNFAADSKISTFIHPTMHKITTVERFASSVAQTFGIAVGDPTFLKACYCPKPTASATNQMCKRASLRKLLLL
jgi:hypothetical protein